MREIKFRAWTTRDKCWIGGFCIHNSGLYSDLINARIEQPQKIAIADAHWKTLKEIDEQKDRIIIMQFTGLKDKNGKEIYEGDIVQFIAYSGARGNLLVEYDKGRLVEPEFMPLEKCKIIGNVYENPELDY